MRKALFLVMFAVLSIASVGQMPAPDGNYREKAAQAPSVKANPDGAINSKTGSPWQEAYSRRNYQLGITISQFRALRYPDQEEWPNARPICTNEERYSLYSDPSDLMSSDWENSGVVQCEFFYNSNDAKIRAGLMLGNIGSLTTFFFISEDGQQEPRLFLIKSGGPSDSYGELLSTFEAAFGKPTTITREEFQTKAGSTFPNEIATWENESSSIQLERFGETSEVLQVTHLLKPLAASLDKKLAEVRAAKAKKL